MTESSSSAAQRSELIDRSTRLAELTREWTALLDRTASDNPYLTPEWMLPWWQAFGAGRDLVTVAVWEDETLVGLAPLMTTATTHARMPATALEFLGTPLADRTDLLAAPEHLPAVCAAVCDALADAPVRWDLMRLREVPDFSPTVAALGDTAGAREWKLSSLVCAHVPVLEVTRPYDDLRGDFKSNIKKQVNNKRNRLKKRGEVSFRRHLPAPDDIPGVLDVILPLEHKSWKGRDAVGIFRSEAQCAFFRDALARLAARRIVDIAYLAVNDAVVAYHLGFRMRGRYYSYNLAFDPDWADCSPGTVLMDELIRDSADSPDVSVLDASRSVPEHLHMLARWSDRMHTHLELTIYPRTMYARGLRVMQSAVAPKLRALRSAVKGVARDDA